MIHSLFLFCLGFQGAKTVTPPVPKQAHEITLAVSKDIAPSSKIQVVINTRNVRAIKITATPVDPVKWLTYQNSREIKPAPIGHPLKSFPITVADKKTKPNPDQADTFYSRQINLPPMKPGVYMLEAPGGDKPAWAVVNVTNLAVVIKRSAQHALAWVSDFKTGNVIPGASFAYYNKNGTPVRSSETHEDGVAQMPITPGEGSFVIRRGHDYAGIPSTQENPDGHIMAHFQTDRPLYRPGQTILFKAVIRRTRGQGYVVSAGSPCTVQLRDPKDNPLDELHLTTTPMGSVSGQFTIPSEGMTGPYSLTLKNGNDTAYQTLTVSEYRKPEFKVEVHPLVKRYLAGQDISFEVDTNYYFGAPVPQAAVHYTIRRGGMPFSGDDSVTGAFYSGDGNLYPRDTYNSDAFVANANAFTDANGKAVITLKSADNVGDSNYSISCTVTDSSRRQVDGGSSVPVYGAAIRLGLSSSLQYATLGSLIPVRIASVDLDGHPASPEVKLAIAKQIYNEKKSEWEEVILTKTSVKLGPKGFYTINLPAKQEGDLTIYAVAEDGTGRVAKTSMGIYVAGNYEKPEKEVEQPAVGIRLDKRVYDTTDTAKAFVTTNNPKRPLLLVVEGGDIWSYKVITHPTRGQLWAFPTDVRYSPNAYVAVEQWVKGTLISGNAMVPIPDRKKSLKVTIRSDKPIYHPGDKATYQIHTEDRTGTPVSSEVALTVVDEAIYALSPDVTADLYKMYWGLRANGVTMATSAPEELSGGAYQRVSAVAPVRQRFEDTAFWGPSVVTDAKGDATVSFEMPGNLTAWRATGRAITMDTSVGTGTQMVTASRPVTLRLATPRQMVEGDRLTIVGTADNRSDQPHEFDIRLDATGVDVEGGNTQHLSLKAKSEGKVQWTLVAGKMPSTGSASLAGQIEATDAPGADNADALRVNVPIVPKGLPERTVVGGSVAHKSTANLDLSTDRLEPATLATIEVRAGIRPVIADFANTVLSNPRYGTLGADNQLEVATRLKLPSTDEHIRESLALLSRTVKGDGWGWWENGPTDPIVTARTLSTLSIASANGIKVFDTLMKPAIEAAVSQYNNTNLWEYRAQLATAVVLSGDSRGKTEVDEVLQRGESLSPYAKLRLARALMALKDNARATKLVGEVLAAANFGEASETYIPTGDGIGWSASDLETTSEAVFVLSRLKIEGDTNAKMVRWLASPDQVWCSMEESAEITDALITYLETHPETIKLGNVKFTVNGQNVPAVPGKFGQAATATIPRELLKDGANGIKIEKDSDGEAFYTIESRVYRPVATETTEGIRVLRRFEVKNAGGIWVELNRPVKPGEPVRCTAIAWGDDLRDAVRVNEPIPAGFELMEDDSDNQGYQEVRDGSVIHYVLNSGAPQTFRYYLRAESEGELTALPLTAEFLRRPRVRGNTLTNKLKVVETHQSQ